MSCTPSIRLSENFPDPGSSSYAEEGTLAHEFADVRLRYANKEITETQLNKSLRKLRKHERYTDEMEAQVEKYTDYVLERLSIARKEFSKAQLLIEARLDFSHIVRDGFGTGDATIVTDTRIEVIDLKYGKGVEVYADENPQLMLYGTGALTKFDLIYDLKTVMMTIVQPRLDSVSEYEMEVPALKAWGQFIVRPKAEMAYEGKGIPVAGSHCRWCRAKNHCRAYNQMHLDVAKNVFQDTELMSDDEILEVYKNASAYASWVKGVHDYVLSQAIKGRTFEGYKLVSGRSSRKWLDEEQVEDVLLDNGYDPDDIVKRKLKGITDISNMMSSDKFEELLSDLVIKPEGKPTLVPETDERQAFGLAVAKSVFAD